MAQQGVELFFIASLAHPCIPRSIRLPDSPHLAPARHQPVVCHTSPAFSVTSGRKPTHKKSPASFHPMPASELSNCTESPRFIIISLLPNTTCLHTKLLVRSSYRHTKKGENRDYCRSFGGHPYIQLRTQKREPFSVHIPSMAAPLSWVEKVDQSLSQEIGGLRVGPKTAPDTQSARR